jgi:hypothetical protein
MPVEISGFASESEAAAAWSLMYRKRSSRKEYAAFIYRTENGSSAGFFIGRTLAGMGQHGILRANVFFPFLFLYMLQAVSERAKHNAKIAAFIHTHPKPAPGYTNSFHSAEDLFLLKLPGICAVYVIPHENQEIIRVERQA